MKVVIQETFMLGRRVPKTEVDLSVDGTVLYEGRNIGRVSKGTRLYSPPLHKGSRVVKFHKSVPCWVAVTENVYSSTNRDTRWEAIAWLIASDILSGEDE